MQIVINVNKDGEINTATKPEADQQTNTTAEASGAMDGGSAPSSSEDLFAAVVTEISAPENDAALDGGTP